MSRRLRSLAGLCVVLTTLAASSAGLAGAQPADLVPRAFLIDSVPGEAGARLVTRGAVVHLSAVIANVGGGPAGEFGVEFSCRRVDREEVCCVERIGVAGLETKGEVTVDTTVNTLDLVPGRYEISVRVDPDGQVLEQDETNNRKSALLTVLASKPELHPISLEFDPASPVKRGETVRVSTEIENSGESTAGEFAVRFLLRRGGIAESFAVPEGDWTLVGSSVVPGLKRDEHLALEETLDTSTLVLDSQEPMTVTPYTIKVVVDATDQVEEEDETNNDILSSLGIEPSDLALPELHPVTLTFNKDLPLGWGGTTSESVTATVLVVNTGGSTARATSEVPIRVSFAYRKLGATDWTEIAADRVRSIRKDIAVEEGKNSATATADLVLGEPGSYELRAWVDPENRIAEQNEGNNQIVVGFSVKGSELHPLGIELGSAPVRQGDAITVRSPVENTGEKTAAQFAVGFFVDDRRFATYTYSGEGLEENKSVKAEGLLNTTDLAPGAYTLRVIVDPDNRIPELDEANNVISTPLLILPPVARRAELHPASLVLDPPSPVPIGQGARVSGAVWNTGTMDADRFQVELAYSSDGGSTWTPFAEEEVPSLARGEKRLVEGRLVTAGLAVGARYLVRIFVDSHVQVEEQDETNNVLATALFLGTGVHAGGETGANLVVADLTFNPPSPVPERTAVQVCAAISNTGQGAAGEFLVEFLYRQGPAGTFLPFATKSMPGLAVGQSALLCETLDTTGFLLGSVEVKAIADSANWASEQDETDNERIRTLLISSSVQRPDLAPVAWRLDPPSPIPQGTSALVCVKVANLGAGTAGAFTVSYAYALRSSVSFATAGAAALAGGGQIELCRALDTSTLAPGTYEVRITVDSEHRVTEQNEGNNELSAYFTVVSPPQPVLQAVVRTGGPVRLLVLDASSGTLYAGSEDGKLYAVERGGGSKAGFPVDVASPVRALAVDARGARTAYVGTADGKVHAIGLDTGLDARQVSLGREVLALEVDRMGNVYVATPDRVVSLTRTGESRWELPTAGAARGLAVDDLRDVIYAATSGGILYAATSAGSLKWQVDLGSPLTAVAMGERVYAGTEDGKIYSVSLGGAASLGFTAGGAIAALIVDQKGTSAGSSVYAASLDGTLVALDRDLGLRWVARAGGPIRAAPRVDARTGIVVFGSDDGKLYAVNPDGSAAFVVNVGSAIRSSPWVDVLVERTGTGVELLRTIQFGAEDRAVYLVKTRL